MSAPPPDALAFAMVTDAPITPSIVKTPSLLSPWSLSTFALFLDLAPPKVFSIVILPLVGAQANHPHGKFSCPVTDTVAPEAEALIQLLIADRGHASKEKILPGSFGVPSVKHPPLLNPYPGGGGVRRRPATWKPLVALARFPTSTPCCNSVGSLAAKQQTRDATETSARMFEKRQ